MTVLEKALLSPICFTAFCVHAVNASGNNLLLNYLKPEDADWMKKNVRQIGFQVRKVKRKEMPKRKELWHLQQKVFMALNRVSNPNYTNTLGTLEIKIKLCTKQW